MPGNTSTPDAETGRAVGTAVGLAFAGEVGFAEWVTDGLAVGLGVVVTRGVADGGRAATVAGAMAARDGGCDGDAVGDVVDDAAGLEVPAELEESFGELAALGTPDTCADGAADGDVALWWLPSQAPVSATTAAEESMASAARRRFVTIR